MAASLTPIVVSNNEPASWIKFPECTRCHMVFDKSSTICTYGPSLLPCGHTICMSCKLILLKSKTPKCAECFVLFSAQEVQCDYYLIGITHYKNAILPKILQHLNSISIADQIHKDVNETKCIECSTNTKHMCVQCSNPYCNDCFLKVHAVGVVIKTHELVLSENLTKPLGKVLGSCKQHDIMKLELYCQTCSEPICSSCVISTHKNHDTMELTAFNKEVELSETIALLKEARNMINKSERDAVECIAKLDFYSRSTCENIFLSFKRLHSILQNLERKAYNQLKIVTTQTLQQLYIMQNKLGRSGEKIKSAISQLTKYSRKLPHNVNLATLRGEVMCLLEDLPIAFNTDQFGQNIFCVNGNDFEKVETFKDLCKIVVVGHDFINETYTFFSANNLQDKNLLIPRLDDSSWSDVIQSLNLETFQISNVKTSQVLVVKVVDPMTYLVQEVGFRIDDIFVKECNQYAMEMLKSIDTVLIDEMYLVHEDDESKWHRGIVKRKILAKYVVFLVDYGRTVEVTTKQIREISEILKNKPPCVTEFTIRHIEPKGGKWSEESIELVSQMTMSLERDCYLTMIHNDDMCGDLILYHNYSTSLRDALLYLNYAIPTNLNEDEVLEDICVRKALLEANKKPTDLKEQTIDMETFSAKVIHVVSPEEIYLGEISIVNELERVYEKMQQFYAKRKCPIIYYPHLEMLCCAFVSGRWHRARIVKRYAGRAIQIYLVDVGTYHKVEWRYLRKLANAFLETPIGVIRCSLIDIAPKNFKKEWGTDETQEIKRLSKNELEVVLCEKNPKYIDIELYIVKNTVKVQINAWLADHKLVEWTGDHSMIVEHPQKTKKLNTSFSPAIVSKTSKNELRQPVIIANIISPSKFYVTLCKYTKAITKLESHIQDAMRNKQPETIGYYWHESQNCLVKTQLSERDKPLWYRGRIVSILRPNSFTIFVRDHGINVTAKLLDLEPIDYLYDKIIDGANLCHLANITPTSDNIEWGKAAIDEFKYMTTAEVGGSFAVSVCGEMKNGAISVYLWGRQKPARNDALFGTPLCWININKLFASKGFGDCSERFKTIVDCDSFDDRIKKHTPTDFLEWVETECKSESDDDMQMPTVKDNLYDVEDVILEPELDPEHEKFSISRVTAWPPAIPIGKYQFNAIATYVDDNAVVYMHDQEQNKYLKGIQYSIKKHIDNLQDDPLWKWSKNTPCLAQFHADKLFYRGLIKEVLKDNTFLVEFVDYGNIEILDSSELRMANILGNIPIQAHKYYLAFLKPASDDEIWDKKIVEFIHIKVVDKIIYVRVEDKLNDEYVPCSITIGPVRLNKLLIAEKLAVETDNLNVILKLPDTYDLYNEANTRDIDKYKESIPLEQVVEAIAKKNEAIKHKEHLDTFMCDICVDYVVEDSDDASNENKLIQSFQLDSEFEEDFVPLDRSTAITTAVMSVDLLPYQPLKLTRDMTRFLCRVTGILDPLHIYVQPLIDHIITEFIDMELEVKDISTDAQEILNFREERACLARYRGDGLYYRALIKDANVSEDKVSILFVDYLEEEMVERKYIRHCPEHILKKPLKNLLVQLNGISTSRRIRDSDIKNSLQQFLKEEAIAIIVKNDVIPSVRLLDSYHQSKLLYQSLIDMRFFTKTTRN